MKPNRLDPLIQAARWPRLALGACALALLLPVRGQEVLNFKWLESGASERSGGYRPIPLNLSSDAPAELMKAPAGLTAPRYGSFQIGPAKAAAKCLVIVDTAEGRPARLIVDANANGDLTDDAVREWTPKEYERQDGTKETNYQSDATVNIPFMSGLKRGHLKFYTISQKSPSGGQPREVVFYYCDYGLAGELKCGETNYPALLTDSGCRGDFSQTGSISSAPILWYDSQPGSGNKRSGRSVLVSRPFELGGKWWAVTNLTPEGAFQLVASAKPPAPKPTGPDLRAGQKAPAFAAKRTDGKTVKFPDDYKGKVVLMDFWATWCGPCVAEIPNVVKAYEKYHSQGLEILGISLDKEDSEKKLAEFTAKKKMPWPQVYDGKFWQAEVAKLYGINSIPHMLLVDGNTGVILADKEIRGDDLAPAVEKALAGLKK